MKVIIGQFTYFYGPFSIAMFDNTGGSWTCSPHVAPDTGRGHVLSASRGGRRSTPVLDLSWLDAAVGTGPSHDWAKERHNMVHSPTDVGMFALALKLRLCSSRRVNYDL